MMQNKFFVRGDFQNPLITQLSWNPKFVLSGDSLYSETPQWDLPQTSISEVFMFCVSIADGNLPNITQVNSTQKQHFESANQVIFQF